MTRRDQERSKREKKKRLAEVKNDIVHGIRVDGAAGGGLVLESEQIVSYRSRRKLVPWLSRGRRERLKMRSTKMVVQRKTRTKSTETILISNPWIQHWIMF